MTAVVRVTRVGRIGDRTWPDCHDLKFHYQCHDHSVCKARLRRIIPYRWITSLCFCVVFLYIKWGMMKSHLDLHKLMLPFVWWRVAVLHLGLRSALLGGWAERTQRRSFQPIHSWSCSSLILDHFQTILYKNQIDLILIRDTYLEIFDRDWQKQELQRNKQKTTFKIATQSARIHTISSHYTWTEHWNSNRSRRGSKMEFSWLIIAICLTISVQGDQKELNYCGRLDVRPDHVKHYLTTPGYPARAAEAGRCQWL